MCLMLAMINVPDACNVQHLLETASDRNEEAANGVELLTNLIQQGLTRATSYCILGNMFH